MNYLDVYKSRISHLGTNYQEHAYKSGILEFRRYLKYNQHTERNLILEKDETIFDGVILTDKEDDNRVSQILLVKTLEDGGPAIQKGDLVLWNDEHWIVYQSTTSSYQPHQKFYMVRCNYKINWLDKNGLVHSSWIYLLGSKDSKIKDNFRTWHNAITPQPNKYINIIMPHQLMDLGTEIMVLDEVWYLVDYDQNSVPGVIFMAFTETNFNEQRDSLEEKLANADKKANWTIDMPKSRTVAPNSIIEAEYSILKDGIVQNLDAIIECEGNLTLLEDGRIQVGARGAGTIIVKTDVIMQSQSIVVGATPTSTIRFVGSEKIRVASTNTYILEDADGENVKFVLNDPDNLVVLKQTGNSCTIIANEKNKLGSFELEVYYNDSLFTTKTISVVSLWQVM